MIETKLFELRDEATFIPIIASAMRSDEPREAWLLRRSGYAPNTTLILLTTLDGGRNAEYDPYAWGGRTFPNAHYYITREWPALKSGQVIDVRTILGETDAPCESEQGMELA